jgi:Arc/MetJ-type ribon-helix-helix transcriptional regulator
MVQTKVSLEQSQIDFLAQFKTLGFKNKSSLVRSALNQLQQQIEKQELERSADLYAEIYEEDKELQQLTTLALSRTETEFWLCTMIPADFSPNTSPLILPVGCLEKLSS